MVAVASESAIDVRLYDLLEEFMTLLRKGQGVPVREFARRYPDFTNRIIADFPALLMAEGLRPKISVAPGTEAAVTAASAPELLAGYRVIRQIGQGGMGVVYEAEHPRLSRRLAIKVLLGRRGNSNLPERFRREAEAASKLSHPSIVSVYDFGEHNGVQYLTMPLIDGVSLDKLLEDYRAQSRSHADTRSQAGLLTLVTNTPRHDRKIAAKKASGTSQSQSSWLTPSQLIGPEADFQRLAKLGADVASALAHAHGAGTIHRDIKPGNLLLSNEGKIWVTDFGLAKVRDDESDLSRTGDVIGTPRFMAPEQMRGLCDERSDIYSLGITLYEMASGTRAWDALNTAQLLKVRASAELPELADQAPFVPKPFAEIIMKACSYRPEDRYQTAQEMQLVLNRFAHGERTGDRRRRPRNGSSLLDRRWIVASTSLGIPSLVFVFMWIFSMGPWAPEKVASAESLMTLIEDDKGREKVVEHLPTLIEAAILSQDKDVREKASNLTMKVMEQAIHKSESAPEDKQAAMQKVKEITDQYKKEGFVYDKLNHPLTNAVRNLDLARQISGMKLSAEDKLSSQAKIAALGEVIRRNLFSQKQIRELLSFLPATAQTRKTDEKVGDEKLIRFMLALNRTYDGARNQMTDSQKQLQTELEREARKGTLTPNDELAKKLSKEFQLDPSKYKSPKLPMTNPDDKRKAPPF